MHAKSGGSDIGYTWETVSQPGQAGAPTFSVNGTNAASQTVATVYGAGSYVFKVIMSNGPDAYGATWPGISQTSTVTVGQTLGSVVVAPVNIDAIAGSTSPLQFTAQALDQFGQPMDSQPAFTWSVLGGTGSAGGSIDPSTGAYTPPASVPSGTTPSDIIQASATVGGITQTANANVSVPSAPLSSILINSTSAVATNSRTLQLTASATDPNYSNNSQLIYIWTVAGASPTFSSSNGTSAGGTVYATWATPPGTFDCTFDLIVEDPIGLTQTALLPVDISPADLPPAPQNLVATPQGNGGINLTWSTVQVGTTLSYAIFRNASATLPNTPLTTVTASQNSSQSYTDSSSLSSGVTYYYWVEAKNASGYSPASSMVSSKLSANTPTLTVPSSMTITGTSVQFSVTGSDPTNQHEPISYNWSVITAPSGATVQLNGAAPSATNAVTTITNLMNATFSQAGSYIFQVTAIDASGFSNPSNVTITVQQVATSVTLNAANPTIFNGQTDTLSGSVLDQFGNAMSLSGASWSVSGIGGTIAPDASMAGQEIYTAPATADGSDAIVLSVGGLTRSATINVIQNSLTTTEALTGLAGLTWNADADAQYYEVFRDSTPGFTPSIDNMVGDNLTDPSFADATVSPATTYYYQVYAISASGDATMVGQGSTVTPALDGAINPGGGSNATPDGSVVNIQAVGVNALEIFVSWTCAATSIDGFDIQISSKESLNDADWTDAATAIAAPIPVNSFDNSYNCIIRTGPDGSFLQQGVPYYIRIRSENAANHSGWVYDFNGTMTADPQHLLRVDAGKDILVICGGNNQPLSDLLQGVTVGSNGQLLQGSGSSVGAIWVHGVNEGYNAFLTADPADGGAPSGSKGMPAPGSVPAWQDVLNNDGSGWLYTEIQQELKTGIKNIGLIGYSHGGGMIANISSRIHNDSNKPLFASVVFAATIDAVQYGTGPDSKLTQNGWDDSDPVKSSPATIWRGSGVNYWEPSGWNLSGSLFSGHIRGTDMQGITNHQMIGDNHSQIGVDPWVLSNLENACDSCFFSLSF